MHKHDNASRRALRRRTVAFLIKHRREKSPVYEVVSRIRRNSWRAALFGGAARDLMLDGVSARPRDIDLVVEDVSADELRAEFRDLVVRQTRFGGLHLSCKGFLFDIWPLADTWAFKNVPNLEPTLSNLPKTTFFNVEAVALELVTTPGRARTIYSEGFFEAIARGCLSVNLPQNPFPELCVLRALLTAIKFNLAMTAELGDYIINHGSSISARDFTELQLSHYGSVRFDGNKVRSWIESIFEKRTVKKQLLIPPPILRPEQLKLFDCARPC